MMLTNKFNHKLTRVVLLAALLLPLSGCNSDSTFFTSGLIKEWSSEQPVSHEALVMNPSYYLQGLGDDLGHIAWLAIPRGKLFQDVRDEYKIRKIKGVLGDYLTLLESLPAGKELPEYQLVTIYHDLANDYVDYLDRKTSMYNIANKIAVIEPDIKKLESRLEEADSRRLSVLLQTFPRYVYRDQNSRAFTQVLTTNR